MLQQPARHSLKLQHVLAQLILDSLLTLEHASLFFLQNIPQDVFFNHHQLT